MFGHSRADDDRVITGAQCHLCSDGDAEHGRARHRDAVGIEVDPVEGVKVALQRVPQRLPAAGVGVERVARVEGLLGGLADELIGHGVAFAEPERDHRRVADARQCDTGNSVLFQGGDFGAEKIHDNHRCCGGRTPSITVRTNGWAGSGRPIFAQHRKRKAGSEDPASITGRLHV